MASHSSRRAAPEELLSTREAAKGRKPRRADAPRVVKAARGNGDHPPQRSRKAKSAANGAQPKRQTSGTAAPQPLPAKQKRQHRFYDISMSSAKPQSEAPVEEVDSLQRRINETKTWLAKMKCVVQASIEKEETEKRSASVICCSARAQSVRRNTGLLSFFDGTPFLTPFALERYNLELANYLSTPALQLIRDGVFQGDEKLFAELLYAENVWDTTSPSHQPNGGAHDHGEGGSEPVDYLSTNVNYNRTARRRRQRAVKEFNKKAMDALKLVFALGLADEVLTAAGLIEISPEGDGEDVVGDDVEYSYE